MKPNLLLSADNHEWPLWAPEWLRQQVENPDCSDGTHPRLRYLAKWLTIYFAEHEGAAQRWLRHAAGRCDREVDHGEVDRLLHWAEGLFGSTETVKTSNGHSKRVKGPTSSARPQVDLERIYRIASEGPRLAQYRSSSPRFMWGSRKTDEVLAAWARYCGQEDPLVCFGADDQFCTRSLSVVRGILHVHAQIVPSPMRARVGLTADGRWSEHTKDGTGPRMFLVAEFDFTKTTPKGKPTIWEPLIDRCEKAGITVLDINAALLAYLARERPLWMTVFSGSKSLQGWFPCRDVSEEELQCWFMQSARRLGADSMTWCKSQFVRLPDGTRTPNREGKSVRQTIEYYDPSVL
jgi:hypothetical protein